MQEAVALAHLSIATGSGDDDEEASTPWPTVADGMPRLLPVPSAWWETPAVTTRALSARPEEARTARRFVRELLTCWGLEALADDAEMIVDELVVNAVLHGTRAGLARGERTRPADRWRAESRVGMEPHRRARQGGMGGATRSLRPAPRTRSAGRARPRRSAPPWLTPCCARRKERWAFRARGPGP